ncbi:hypothetical protein EMCRGX_G004136 [Ephydatia muelleri]
MFDTRWSARPEAPKALSEGYDNIRAALLHIVQDPEQRADTQQEANGLHISLSYLDTIFMAVFWNIILKRFNRVSMALQNAEIELGTAVKLLQSLQDFVSELRGNFDAIEMRAKQKDPSAKYKDAEKRIRKPKTQFGDESNGLLLCPSSPHLASCKRREMVDCFLPSQEDMNVVQSDMEVLVARILCDYIKDLRQLKKFVVTHIPHTYCDKMAEKSEVVVLDVLHKNETKSSDMVHIMREMASYLGGD